MIDGVEVLRQDIRDKDGSNDSSLHELDQDFAVVPRGKHRIAVDNLGNDWVAVDWFVFSNYRRS